MIEIRETEAFGRWFDRIRDARARAKVLVRIRRLSLGLPGDVRAVGGGVSELRTHSGPGYRVDFIALGRRTIVLLIGGVKDSQERDIATAKQLAVEVRQGRAR